MDRVKKPDKLVNCFTPIFVDDEEDKVSPYAIYPLSSLDLFIIGHCFLS